MALPDSVIAARARRDLRANGYRPTIQGVKANGSSSMEVDPFGGTSLSQRVKPTMSVDAPSAPPMSRQAAPVAIFDGPAISQRTTPNNLGGALPYSTAQKEGMGKSLVDGAARPGFSAFNLPPPQGSDPILDGFASISGKLPNTVASPPKNYPPGGKPRYM